MRDGTAPMCVIEQNKKGKGERMLWTSGKDPVSHHYHHHFHHHHHNCHRSPPPPLSLSLWFVNFQDIVSSQKQGCIHLPVYPTCILEYIPLPHKIGPGPFSGPLESFAQSGTLQHVLLCAIRGMGNWCFLSSKGKRHKHMICLPNCWDF